MGASSSSSSGGASKIDKPISRAYSGTGSDAAGRVGQSQQLMPDTKVAIAPIMCEVIPGLWLGSRAAATQLGLLKSLGIAACINCTEESNLHPQHLAYHQISVSDSANVDILQYVNHAVVEWISRQHGGVLIYCHQDVSRSVTVTLAVLLHLRPAWSLLNCWHHLKHVRPSARPNPGFLQGLVDYERKLRNESTVRVSNKKRALIARADAPTKRLDSSRVV